MSRPTLLLCAALGVLALAQDVMVDGTPEGAGADASSDAQESATTPTTPSKPGGGRSATRPRGGGRRNKRKNQPRCRLPGCSRCSPDDKTVCLLCRQGFALNPTGQCEVCGTNCKECPRAGPGGCDVCKPGFTIDPITGQCARCAAHCLKCDEAGPGGCNECGPRRMLHARLEVTGEVHECLPCDTGCRSCSLEEGCKQCDSFYSLRADGHGCDFSWWRVWALILVILVPIGLCAWATAADEAEAPRPRRPLKQTDAAHVVRGGDDGSSLRQRGGRASLGEQEPDASPRQASSHHTMTGYSGIEIVETLHKE